MTRRIVLVGVSLTVVALVITVPAAMAASCESLVTLRLADTTTKSASSIPGGPFTPPGAAPTAAPLMLPAFCRVVGVAAPAVNFEVWLPLEKWNGKFQAVGNGGTAGVISYLAMATALTRGYATASTDTGHVNKQGFDSTWALGRPDLIADFGHRALHVATTNAKQTMRAFYGKPATYSYFVGCSKGGQQGLMEAQRYPQDFDGIVAGDPANNWTRFYAGAHLWYSLATLKDPESYIPADRIPVLANAVNTACDALDGIKDGVLSDPRTCTFDPAALTCKHGQDPATCFTPKQVTAVKEIWAGARNSKGELIYPGLLPGGEAGAGGWSGWTTGTGPFTGRHWAAAEGFFKYMIFENSHWDFRSFNYDSDVPVALGKVGSVLDSVNPDLRLFRQRGGRLLTYHGWSDPDISPIDSVNYYERVVSFLAGGKDRTRALADTQEFFRLFMVPGLQHCTGGPGPNTFDMLTALEHWVEKGVAPQTIVATKFVNDDRAQGVLRTRPLCPYPQAAQWKGTGSTDDASSFTCVNDEQ